MLNSLDKELFLFLNSHHTPFWDAVMYFISGKLIWVPLYAALLAALGFKYKRKMLVLVLVIAAGITLGDRTSVLIKNTVKRPRPCYEQTLAGQVHTVKGECGGKYGFVSSHATNTFAVAVMILLILRIKWVGISMLIWAAAISYSRIYLGVHYPGDVLAGTALGIITGWCIFILYDKIDKKVLKSSHFFNAGKSDREPNV